MSEDCLPGVRMKTNSATQWTISSVANITFQDSQKGATIEGSFLCTQTGIHQMRIYTWHETGSPEGLYTGELSFNGDISCMAGQKVLNDKSGNGYTGCRMNLTKGYRYAFRTEISVELKSIWYYYDFIHAIRIYLPDSNGGAQTATITDITNLNAETCYEDGCNDRSLLRSNLCLPTPTQSPTATPTQSPTRSMSSDFTPSAHMSSSTLWTNSLPITCSSLPSLTSSFIESDFFNGSFLLTQSCFFSTTSLFNDSVAWSKSSIMFPSMLIERTYSYSESSVLSISSVLSVSDAISNSESYSDSLVLSISSILSVSDAISNSCSIQIVLLSMTSSDSLSSQESIHQDIAKQEIGSNSFVLSSSNITIIVVIVVICVIIVIVIFAIKIVRRRHEVQLIPFEFDSDSTDFEEEEEEKEEKKSVNLTLSREVHEDTDTDFDDCCTSE